MANITEKRHSSVLIRIFAIRRKYMQKLKLIKHADIDREKWDATISQAFNCRIYAMSWYLDILNPQWNGVIYGDYEYVMPIFKSKKYGLNFVYQPTYAQQHGVFPSPQPEIFDLFIKKVSQLAPYIIIAFNSENNIQEGRFILQKKPNYILPLASTYEEMWVNYSKSHKRYVKSANKQVTISEISIEEYLQLKKENSNSFVNEDNLEKLHKILTKTTEKGICKILGAYTEKKNLVSGGVFINFNKRILYLNGTSNDDGKNLRAMYTIVDQMITENVGKDLTVDFEGSSISGIATFFSRFGAKPEYYTIAKRNSIPILKYFMK